MVGGISSSAVIPIKSGSHGLRIGHGSGAALDLSAIPKSKVKVEALHTEKGRGLKIDIKV
ncbi:MAG: hypothetical protein EP335_03835 [Alphaproteobacteria bacterium]|nr:MAG: hypothetical protein EP335_03835 [Alphaproteobacteria bacterium]